MINLDKIAAERAQEMVAKAMRMKKLNAFERLVTKSLGVLQEQGVYALMIFLFSRTRDEAVVAPVICIELYRILTALPTYSADEKLQKLIQQQTDDKQAAQASLEFYSGHVLNDLDQLLLVRDLYEQTMTYARYNAKAFGS